MRKTFVIALTALLAAFSLTGCSSSDNYTGELSPDCAITAVMMGTLYRDYHTQLSNGKDTNYVITLPGAAFPMHIDQLKAEVYNIDSLPKGTMKNKVVFTTFTTDGTILLRSLSGSDTLYSTKDTVDFTTPRTFTIYTADGTSSRAYTVKVNVHTSNPYDYTWTADGAANSEIAGMSETKALVSGGMLYLWGRTAKGVKLLTRADAENAAWASAEADTRGIDLQSITVFKDEFYAVSPDGLMRSADGATWTAAGADITPLHILGANSQRIYASTASGAYSSADGTTWTADDIDAPASLLPATGILTATQPTLTNPGIENIIAVGFADGEPVVWKKEIDLSGVHTNAWSYYPYTDENRKSLPAMDGASLIKYDNNLVAVGMLDGKPAAYYSSDGARTWHASDANTILSSKIGEPAGMSLAAGSGNVMWLVCTGTGQLWRGYRNDLITSGEE